MPRARRAQGRPGTPVFPAGWSQSHGLVLEKTMTAKCQLLPPGGGAPVFDPAQHASTRAAAEPTYNDVCRVQVLKAQEGVAVVGEQTQSTMSYLVTIRLGGAGADEITLAHTVLVTECADDPSLVDKRLTVASIARASVRFERDLFCTEDQSAPPA